MLTEGSKYRLGRWKPIAIDDLVRIGRDRDGGYVLSARCIANTDILIGLGIADDWSFEDAFVIARPNTKVIGVDGAVSAEIFRNRALKSVARAIMAGASIRFPSARLRLLEAKAQWLTHKNFHKFFGPPLREFHKKFIAEEQSDETIQFDQLVSTHLLDRDRAEGPRLFVKMDIEGSEYRVLPDVIELSDNINGMAIEFHDCDLLWERFAELMDRLAEKFEVVHIHGNNYSPLIQGTSCPRVLEVSLVNRVMLHRPLQKSAARYPLADLDKPCDPNRDDYRLEF